MAKVMTDESNYSAIASQIRSKLGVSTRYKPSEMAAAIGSISGVSSSDNGKVVVDGQLTQQTSRSVSQNGTYDTTTNNEVTVNVSGGGGGYEAVVVFDSSSGISQGYTYADVYNGTEGSTPSYDANGRIQVIGGTNNRKFAGFIIDLSNVEYVVLEGEFNNINNTTGAIVESDVSTIKTNVSGSITSGFDAYCTAYVADTTIMLPIDVSALSGTYYVGIIGYESGWNSWLSSVKLYRKASGDGSTNILSGSTVPTASDGEDGDVYLQYTDNAGSIVSAYLKVDGSWLSLIGQDITDVNLGS